MRSPRPWPAVYKVRIWAVAEQPEEYEVLTWLHEEKAVILAAEAFVRLHGRSAYDAEVEEIGPAERDEHGTVGIPDGMLGDRMEF